MIKTNQLATMPGAVRCKCCGKRFEVSSRILGNPERLLMAKERIAAAHTCRAYEPVNQVYRMPTEKIELEKYWNQAVARLMPA